MRRQITAEEGDAPVSDDFAERERTVVRAWLEHQSSVVVVVVCLSFETHTHDIFSPSDNCVLPCFSLLSLPWPKEQRANNVDAHFPLR